MRIGIAWLFARDLFKARMVVEPPEASSLLERLFRDFRRRWWLTAFSAPAGDRIKSRVDGKEVDAVIVILVDRIARLATTLSKAVRLNKEKSLERLLISFLNATLLHELVHLYGDLYGDERDEGRVENAVAALMKP